MENLPPNSSCLEIQGLFLVTPTGLPVPTATSPRDRTSNPLRFRNENRGDLPDGNLTSGLSRRIRMTTKDAIIWWFVPLLWYWRPYQVMQEIWAGSHSENHHPRLLLLWWATWVIGGTLYWFAYISGENTLSQVYWGNLMTIGASGVNILAGVLAIATVWQTTSAQERKYIRLKTACHP